MRGVLGRISKTTQGKTAQGQITRQFSLNLCLPDQYDDTETGLFYNKQRYNSLKHLGPEGLILFAFDGTVYANDDGDLAALDNGILNVWNFRQLHSDGNRSYVAR